MNPSDPTGFGKFVPGFEFMQSLAKGDTSSMAGWVAPTLDPQALDKRIQELKAVQYWLDQNAAALKATLQALEVQKMTLATLKSMNMSMPGAPAAAGAAGSKGAADQAAKSGAGPAAPDPVQFWSALTKQFQQIAASTMKNAAAQAAAATASAPASGEAAKPAAKSAGKGAKAAPAAAKRAPAAKKAPKRSS